MTGWLENEKKWKGVRVKERKKTEVRNTQSRVPQLNPAQVLYHLGFRILFPIKNTRSVDILSIKMFERSSFSHLSYTIYLCLTN